MAAKCTTDGPRKVVKLAQCKRRADGGRIPLVALTTNPPNLRDGLCTVAVRVECLVEYAVEFPVKNDVMLCVVAICGD